MVAERTRPSAARAMGEGLARVADAPVVLAGIIALVSFYGSADDARHGIGAVLLWAFLTGGILDRYARARPTRSRGFFGACGAHFGAMLRLAGAVLLIVGLVHLAMGREFPNDYVHMAAFGLALLVVLVLTLAQVRIAVEDRRSALGALLAGGRFVVRNPGVIGLYALFVAAAMGAMLGFERIEHAAAVSESIVGLAAEVTSAIECFLALAWLATAVSLFQSRLAHAGYTAGPPLTWPESPAAEAIGNAAPAAPR
jgi:hypothetical protein